MVEDTVYWLKREEMNIAFAEKSRKNRTLFAVQFRLTDCDRDREEMNGR